MTRNEIRRQLQKQYAERGQDISRSELTALVTRFEETITLVAQVSAVVSESAAKSAANSMAKYYCESVIPPLLDQAFENGRRYERQLGK